MTSIVNSLLTQSTNSVPRIPEVGSREMKSLIEGAGVEELKHMDQQIIHDNLSTCPHHPHQKCFVISYDRIANLPKDFIVNIEIRQVSPSSLVDKSQETPRDASNILFLKPIASLTNCLDKDSAGKQQKENYKLEQCIEDPSTENQPSSSVPVKIEVESENDCSLVNSINNIVNSCPTSVESFSPDLIQPKPTQSNSQFTPVQNSSESIDDLVTRNEVKSENPRENESDSVSSCQKINESPNDLDELKNENDYLDRATPVYNVNLEKWIGLNPLGLARSFRCNFCKDLNTLFEYDDLKKHLQDVHFNPGRIEPIRISGLPSASINHDQPNAENVSPNINDMNSVTHQNTMNQDSQNSNENVNEITDSNLTNPLDRDSCSQNSSDNMVAAMSPKTGVNQVNKSNEIVSETSVPDSITSVRPEYSIAILPQTIIPDSSISPNNSFNHVAPILYNSVINHGPNACIRNTNDNVNQSISPHLCQETFTEPLNLILPKEASNDSQLNPNPQHTSSTTTSHQPAYFATQNSLPLNLSSRSSSQVTGDISSGPHHHINPVLPQTNSNERSDATSVTFTESGNVIIQESVQNMPFNLTYNQSPDQFSRQNISSNKACNREVQISREPEQINAAPTVQHYSNNGTQKSIGVVMPQCSPSYNRIVSASNNQSLNSTAIIAPHYMSSAAVNQSTFVMNSEPSSGFCRNQRNQVAEERNIQPQMHIDSVPKYLPHNGFSRQITTVSNKERHKNFVLPPPVVSSENSRDSNSGNILPQYSVGIIPQHSPHMYYQNPVTNTDPRFSANFIMPQNTPNCTEKNLICTAANTRSFVVSQQSSSFIIGSLETSVISTQPQRNVGIVAPQVFSTFHNGVTPSNISLPETNLIPQNMSSAAENQFTSSGKNPQDWIRPTLSQNMTIPPRFLYCRYCNFTSELASDIITHLKHIHNKVTCNHCLKAFKNKYDLFFHMKRFHRNIKCHQCSYCTLRFTRAEDLRDHSREFHWRRKEFNCSHCRMGFDTEKDIANHVSSVHSFLLPLHSCNHCDYNTNQVANLYSHLEIVHGKTANGVKSNVGVSGASSQTEPSPSAHTPSPALNCSHCSFTASSSSELRKHESLVHSGAIIFYCHHCDYCARSKYHLKLHIMKIHLKKKPFTCYKCKQSFNRVRQLRNHMVTVHRGKKVVRCHKCNYIADNYSQIKKHISMKHRNNSLSYKPKVVD